MSNTRIKVEGEFYDYEIEYGDFSALLCCDGGWWRLTAAPNSKQQIPFQSFIAKSRVKAITRALEFLEKASLAAVGEK